MSRTYNVDILLNVLNQSRNPLSSVISSMQQLRQQAANGSREFVLLQRALESLSKPIGGANFLEDFIDTLKKAQGDVNKLANTNIGKNIPGTLRQLEVLIGALKSARRNAEQLGNINLTNTLSDQIDLVEKLNSQFKEQAKINSSNTQEISRQKAIIDSQISDATKNLGKIRKEYQDLSGVGSAAPKKDALIGDVDETIDKLKNLRTELIGIGKSTTSVDVKIADAENLKRQLQNVTELTDALARNKYEIKLEAGQKIKNITDQIKNLKKTLEEAAEKRNLNLVAKIQLETDTLGKEIDQIRKYGESVGDSEILKNASKLKVSTNEFKRSIVDTKNAIPTGVSGYFATLRDSINNTKKAVGGADGLFRTFAGGLRLVGTSAFLVGGQFRTLGFGASALGNILQTFGPLVTSIASALGPLAPLIAPIGAAAAVTALQLGGLTVALVSVIDVGFKFNNQFAKVQTSVSAVAREFFNFSSSSAPIASNLDAGASAAAEFELAGSAVAKELKALQLEATRTEFTAQDLFEAFQSTTSALGNLSPSLEASRKLTGLFARTASIARVPISQLGSSISQIVAGTGRVTNPLVRDVFNKLKDSQGIALTAKRIRELRAQGGTVLFDELTAALQRFTSGVGELQAERTLSGAFSNLEDLFQIFSGEASKPAFDLVVSSLVKVRDAVVSINKTTGEVKFTEPFQKLAVIAEKFITRLGGDFTSIINRILEWAKTLGTYFENNYEQFVAIYEIIKEFLAALGNIVSDFLELFGLTKSTGTSLSVIRVILGSIVAIVQSIQIGFNAVYLSVLLILKSSNFLFNQLGNLLERFIGDNSITNWGRTVGKSLDENIAERLESISNGTKNLRKNLTATFNPETFRADLQITKKEEQATVLSTPTGAQPQKDQKGASSKANLRLLEEYNQFYNALLKLDNDYNDIVLERVRKRVEREQELINSQVELGLTTQIAAETKLKDLRLGFINSQITRLELQRENERRANENNLENSRRQQAVINNIKNSEQEAADAKLRSEKESVSAITALNQAQLQSLKIDEDINNLKYERLKIELESLKAQTQSTLALRKESLELSAAVASLQYPDSFIALNSQLKLEIRQAADEYLRLTKQIELLQNAQTESERTLRQLSIDKLNALKLQLALSQQQATFDQIQRTALRELNNLSIEQAEIQREVEFGRISAEAGLVRVTKLNYEYGKALEVVLSKLKEVGEENRTPEQRAQILELEQRLRSLKEGLTESTLIGASNSLRESLVGTFVSIQENAGGAVDAIKSFAQSVLGTFRRLLAEKIVRDFFDKLFPTSGQSSGEATGIFAKILRPFGFDPATRARQEAANAPGNAALEQRISEEVRKATTFGTIQNRVSEVTTRLEEEKDKLLKTFAPLIDKLGELGKAAEDGASKISLEKVDFKTAVQDLLAPLKPQLTEAFKNLTDDIRKQLNTYLSEVFGFTVKSESGRPVGTAGSAGTSRTGGIRQSRTSGSRSGTGVFGGVGGGSARGTSAGSDEETSAAAKKDDSAGAGSTADIAAGGFEIPANLETAPAKRPVGTSILGKLADISRYNLPSSIPGAGIIGAAIDLFRSDTAATSGSVEGFTAENRAAAIKARQGNQALAAFLPETAFSSLNDKQLLTFNIDDSKNQFKKSLNLRLNQEYLQYNQLKRAPDGSLEFFGLSKDPAGNLISKKIPAISKYTADIILERSGNKVSSAANIASQIISDIAKVTQLTKELENKSNLIAIKNASIKDGAEKLNSGKFEGQRSAYQASIDAAKSAIPGIQQEANAKFEELKKLTEKLSNFRYNANTFSSIDPVSATFRLDPTSPVQPIKRASGGAVFGKGGPTEDSIPAMLSNGEYVVNANSVKKLGVSFFDRLNNVQTYADGGKLIDTLYKNSSYVAPAIDTSKFNYFGGAGSLIKNPAQIVEAAAKKVEPQKKKKRGIFGSILSGIAPFLNAIPIVGPFLALGVGAAGGALSGSEKGVMGGILGGIFGGLSNLGGFSGSKGFMGNLSKFFGEGGKGAPFLSLLGMSGAGNIGNTLGQGLSGITNQLLSLKAPTNLINQFDRNSARNIIAGGASGNKYSSNNIASILQKLSPKFKFAGGGLLPNAYDLLNRFSSNSFLGNKKPGFLETILGMLSSNPMMLGGIGSLFGGGGGMFGMLLPMLLGGLFKGKSSGKGSGILGSILPMLGGILPKFALGGFLNTGLLKGVFSKFLGKDSFFKSNAGLGLIGSFVGPLLGPFGLLLPLLLPALFGNKSTKSPLETAPSPTGQISGMAFGGVVPSGPKSSTLGTGIFNAFKSITSGPKKPKYSGIMGSLPSIMDAALNASNKISNLKLPDLKNMDASGFNILAKKGGWKIGFGKAAKFNNGGTVKLPIQDTSWINRYLSSGTQPGSSSGGNASNSILQLALTLGGMFLPGLLNKTPKEPDYSITDPDAARKNRFGSAYDSLVEYGIIGEYKYQKETLEALRRGSKWRPVQRQKSNAGGLLSTILPLVLSTASGLIPTKKARGGMVTGPGTGTSDSIPAWLSSGEYVIKASAVRSLGTDILDNINDGRFKFAQGGLAGEGVKTLPQIDYSSSSSVENPVTVNSNTKVVNVLDPNLLGDYLQTTEGTKLLINVISRRSREIKSILDR